MTPAILIAGHGSRDPDGITEFLDLARHFRKHRPGVRVEIAFLEFARPTIQEGIDRLVHEGAEFDATAVREGILAPAGELLHIMEIADHFGIATIAARLLILQYAACASRESREKGVYARQDYRRSAAWTRDP